jgi:hypothetical protein
MKNEPEVFKLDKIIGDPRFEGFAIRTRGSLLGREEINDDLTPGFDAEENPNWQQPRMKNVWKTPKVIGRVSEFNDYPCADMLNPVFSDRAIKALGPMLTDNGELLSLDSKTKTRYFLYNILTTSDSLDCKKSRCDWYKRGIFADDVKHFVFDSKKVRELSIFRLRVYPGPVLVTRTFVDRVMSHGLRGFSFQKLWPLPKNVDWDMQPPLNESDNKKLKRQTLIVVLPLTGVRAYKKKVGVFEDEVDSRLQVKRVNSTYLGSYEGHDIVGKTYRMFFSAPDAKKLFSAITAPLKALAWPKQVTVYLRDGGMYDDKAKEVTKVLEPN